VSILYEDLLKCMIRSCCILRAVRNVLVKVVEINGKLVLCSEIFSRKSWYLCDKMEKYGTDMHSTRGSIIRRVKKLRAL